MHLEGTDVSDVSRCKWPKARRTAARARCWKAAADRNAFQGTADSREGEKRNKPEKALMVQDYLVEERP